MTKFSKAEAIKPTATTKIETQEEATGATVTVDTPVVELNEKEAKMQKQIDDLTKMVRTVSDRNAVDKFDDAQKWKGNTMYALPLYEGKIVRSWNYVNPLQVKLMKGEADDSVELEMYDGTKLTLTYRLWVKTMYATEQIHSITTSVKDGETIVSFSYKAIGDEKAQIYDIDKRFLNAR